MLFGDLFHSGLYIMSVISTIVLRMCVTGVSISFAMRCKTNNMAVRR